MSEQLFEALKNLKSPPEANKEFRLYYDDRGEPLFYSMEQHDANFIVVDAETYAQGRYDIVIDDQQRIVPKARFRYKKLIPADVGTACHASDVMIVDQQGSQYWTIKHYETD